MPIRAETSTFSGIFSPMVIHLSEQSLIPSTIFRPKCTILIPRGKRQFSTARTQQERGCTHCHSVFLTFNALPLHSIHGTIAVATVSTVNYIYLGVGFWRLYSNRDNRQMSFPAYSVLVTPLGGKGRMGI